MVEIIPAIMVKDQFDLKEDIGLVHGQVPLVQIDVMDGHFVPRKSWPYSAQGGYTEDFVNILAENDALPFWKDLDYELDLMIQNPDQNIDEWIVSGAKRLIFHIESFTSHEVLQGTETKEQMSPIARFEKMLSELRTRFPKGITDSIANIEIGLSLNTTTPLEKITPFIEQIDFVQCMGIEKIGFQGQPFDTRVLEQVSTLRKNYPGLIISVDGSVNEQTVPLLVKAGANRLVIGSAIFESEDVWHAIRSFRELANGNN